MNNIQAFEETISFSAWAVQVPESVALQEEIKERCNAYHQGLTTLHELVLYVHDITNGGEIQAMNEDQVSIVFAVKLRLTDVMAVVTIKLK